MKFPYLLVDLTHTVSSDSPTWDGNCGFTSTVRLDYDQCPDDVKFRVQKFDGNAGIGTHIDAPAHCVPGGLTVDQLSLSNLVSPCVVVDVSLKAEEKYSVSAKDIQDFEGLYGAIAPGTFVIIKTGWEQFWSIPDKYRNNLVFPSVSADAAVLLLERGVSGVGIDTLSPDRPEDGFPVHRLLLGAGKYIVENMANLDQMPTTGSFIMVLPMKVQSATEAPARVVGLIKNQV